MYRWRAFGKSCWRRIKAAIQIFEMLQTTTYIKLTFFLLGLKLHTKKKQWLRLSLRTIEYATNTFKKLLYLPMVKGKRNGLTSTECYVKICRFLPLSSPYWKWSYHNATQSECAQRLVCNCYLGGDCHWKLTIFSPSVCYRLNRFV